LAFIQKDVCRDGTAHKYSLIYKFYSPHTKHHYILKAEYHDEDVYVVKFYVQSHHSTRRYSTITNRGDFCNIMITCCNLVPILLQDRPSVSFGFMGGRTIDSKSKNQAKRLENLNNNQRFRLYSEIAALKFGQVTFEHIAYETISSYLLLNRSCQDLGAKELAIKRMFVETYSDMLDV
jgi:hypothetical protein